jgi:HNH endonuclease
MSNEHKAETLGMPFGTANGKLRKMILFDLLKRHNENVCVRCHEPILLIEDLSIEHIKPWEGISAELFWDLNNIAFSHLKCNRPCVYRSSGAHRRKIGPEGTSWCVGHQKFLSVDLFTKNLRHWTGYEQYCKECTGNRDRRNGSQKRFPNTAVVERKTQ